MVWHELVHLEHANHSDLFWKRLSELFPDYEEKMEWLNRNQHVLAFSKQDFLQ